MILEEWRYDPHELWFNLIYMMYESSEQFLWKKSTIVDQLFGKYPMPGELNHWATGINIKFGIISRRFLGVGTICDIDATNQSAQVKMLIDPRLVPSPMEIKESVSKILGYAFDNGLERIYGYLPLTGSKTLKHWERVLRVLEVKEIVRRVGIERHAIRTSKRRIGRILFEAVRPKEG
mgnify:CR=1 FL=1